METAESESTHRLAFEGERKLFSLTLSFYWPLLLSSGNIKVVLEQLATVITAQGDCLSSGNNSPLSGGEAEQEKRSRGHCTARVRVRGRGRDNETRVKRERERESEKKKAIVIISSCDKRTFASFSLGLSLSCSMAHTHGHTRKLLAPDRLSRV